MSGLSEAGQEGRGPVRRARPVAYAAVPGRVRHAGEPRRWRPPEAWACEAEAYPGEAVLRDLAGRGSSCELAHIMARFSAARTVALALADADAAVVREESVTALAYAAACGQVEARALASVVQTASRPGPELERALERAARLAQATGHRAGAAALLGLSYRSALQSAGWSRGARAAERLARLTEAANASRCAARWRRRAAALRRQSC